MPPLLGQPPSSGTGAGTPDGSGSGSGTGRRRRHPLGGLGARFPFGRAPLWLLIIAIGSSLLRLLVQGERPRRPDIALVTFSTAHYDAYRRAIPAFERTHHATVQVQLASWASLQSRLQNAVLAGTDVPDLVEVFEGSLGFFTRGPTEDIGLTDLTPRLVRDGLIDRLVASRFSLWTARGRIYAVPHDVHPVMLAYRRDLIERLGVDVNSLDTWDAFVAVGRRLTADLDGDGVEDRYMLNLPYDGSSGLVTLLLQDDGALFDADGRVAFDSPKTAEVITWYLHQTAGPRRIAYDAGDGQSLAKSISDGLVLFSIMPDWRSYLLETDLPRLAGKMALMPLPAWRPGGRRTSVWGGTGLIMMKQTKNPDLAWELAKFLYFDPADLGRRFLATNIIPVLKDAWHLPELNQPNPYYSNQPVGRLYAALAGQTPEVHSSPVDALAHTKLIEAFGRIREYYLAEGDETDGARRALDARIHAELARAATYVSRMAERGELLAAGAKR